MARAYHPRGVRPTPCDRRQTCSSARTSPPPAAREGRRARRREGLRRDPDLQPEPAGVEADGVLGGRRSRSSARQWTPAGSTRCSSTPSTCSTRPARRRSSATRRGPRSSPHCAPGDALGAHAVVLHPGSAKAGKVGPAIKRAGKVIAQALKESDRCPLHLENTAGTGGTLGRSFEELAALFDAAGDSKRLGLCLDSCHLFASGYDIRTEEGLADRPSTNATRPSGASGSARCTSTTRRRRWGPTATATPTSVRARSGAAAARSSCQSRAFEDLPCVLETQGPQHTGPSREEITLLGACRTQGLRRRS